MDKGGLREHIETIVKLLPRPQSNGRHLAKARNSWSILNEQEDGEGIVLLHTITNHEGTVPYDSIREYRRPDMLILRVQVLLGQDGEFVLEPVVDTASHDWEFETTDILAERLSDAELALSQCTPGEIRMIRELLIRRRMTKGEIAGFCESNGIPDGHKFFAKVSGRTPFLERENNNASAYYIWIKPVFVPILETLLLKLKKDKGVTLSPPSLGTPEIT